MISADYLLRLKTQMIADFKRHDYADWQADRYESTFEFIEGKKYIKIVCDGSVKGFIVNVDNDKQFQLGTLLKADGWATPARNFGRGSIFDEAAVKKVTWTGIS